MINDFLVLGLVPGTNFQITYNEVLMALDLAVLFALIWIYHNPTSKIKYYYLYLRFYLLVRKTRQLKLQPLVKLTERTN